MCRAGDSDHGFVGPTFDSPFTSASSIETIDADGRIWTPGSASAERLRLHGNTRGWEGGVDESAGATELEVATVHLVAIKKGGRGRAPHLSAPRDELGVDVSILRLTCNRGDRALLLS